MRDPSIHIKKSDLLALYRNDIVNDLFMQCNRFSVKNRLVVSLKTKERKQLERVIKSTTDHVELFNMAYSVLLREKNPYMKFSSIHKNDRRYIVLKEVTQQAMEFAEMFKFNDLGEAFKSYIELAYEVSSKHNFGIYILKSAYPKIIRRYEVLMKIKTDTNSAETSELYNTWKETWKQYAGNYPMSLIGLPETYVNFVYLREYLEQIGLRVNYTYWMEAQFDKFAFMDTVPEFSQLYGDNARLAYEKYMVKIKREGAKHVKPTQTKKHKEAIETLIKNINKGNRTESKV